MIDVKTLRIGSHVEYKGKIVRICSLKARMANYDDGKGKPCCFSSMKAYYKDLQPIPITPELLNELGFEYHEYKNGKLWEWDFSGLYKSYGYLEFDESTNSIWRGRAWSMKEIEIEFKVEFLHELENILYMIYGIEFATKIK